MAHVRGWNVECTTANTERAAPFPRDRCGKYRNERYEEEVQRRIEHVPQIEPADAALGRFDQRSRVVSHTVLEDNFDVANVSDARRRISADDDEIRALAGSDCANL